MKLIIGEINLAKYFSPSSLTLGAIGGTVVNLLGGWDLLLQTIILLIVIDYLSGILKAIYKRKLSSSLGYKGIVKKIMMLLVIALAYAIQQIFSVNIPIREITISLFIGNESLSILENAAVCDLPIPKSLKEVLIQVKKEYEEHPTK